MVIKAPNRPFGDGGGPAWQRGHFEVPEWKELFVEMACCGFRFSADHPDDTGKELRYSCPMCTPGEYHARATMGQEQYDALVRDAMQWRTYHLHQDNSDDRIRGLGSASGNLPPKVVVSESVRRVALDISTIRQRLAKASPAPWWVDYDYRDDGADEVRAYMAPHGGLPAMSKTFTVAFMPTPKEDHDFDAALIAHAPEDITLLLGEVGALRAALRQLIVAIDASPGAAATADAYNAAVILMGTSSPI